MAINTLSKKILEKLCLNSRTTITTLSKEFKISRPIISKHIKNLENELGLRYTLELNYKALGFNNIQLLYLKLIKKPSNEMLHHLIDNSAIPQLAIKTHGDFDLVIFALSKNSTEQGKWEFGLQHALSKYGVRAVASDIDILHYGFLPISKEVIGTASIEEVYKKLLVVLNENSRITVKNLASKLKINEDMVSYYIAKLVKSGIIRKFTAIVTKPPLKTNMLFFATYTFNEGMVDRIIRKRNEVYFKKVQEPKIASEYQMIASLSGGEQDFVWGLYENDVDAISSGVNVHKKIFEKDQPEIKQGFVKEVLKGVMPIRNIDVRANYEATEWPTPAL